MDRNFNEMRNKVDEMPWGCDRLIELEENRNPAKVFKGSCTQGAIMYPHVFVLLCIEARGCFRISASSQGIAESQEGRNQRVRRYLKI